MSSLILQDKLAVVTGGTRGIGKAITQKLLQHGAKVIITGTKNTHTVPDKGQYYQVDFSDEINTQDFANYLLKQQPDILINNAGINIINPFADISLDDFNHIYKVNVQAPFLLCRSVIASMKRKQWGRIVNISSIFGNISKEYRASYSASKFAIDGMTAALAAEVAQFGILANCVAPGIIETDLTKKILGEEKMIEIAKQIPLRRLGKPEEIATFVSWLAGPENTYISGQHIMIDGGFSRV